MKNTYFKVLAKNWTKIKKDWVGFLTLSMMLLSFQTSAQLFNVAGNCTMTVASTTYGPMNSTTNPAATNRTAVIYPATQLAGISGQELTSIYFNRIGATVDPTVGTPNFKLYLKETSSLDFGAGALDWATVVTGATLVYDSNPLTAVQGGLGWKQIAFSTNFTYSGTNNLVLLMEYVNTGNSTNVQWQYEYTNPCVVTSNSTTTKYINNTTGTLGTSLTSQDYRRPQIAFDYTVLCNAPTNILMTGITSTSVTFDWTAGGTETDWDYAIQPQGTGIPAVFTATTVSDITDNTLTSNTNYEFYVRANCGGSNGESVWKGPYNFTTPCVAANIPFFEGFETGYTHNAEIAGCWSQELPSGTKKWTANNTLTTYNRAPHTGAWDATLGYSGESWMFQGINLVAGTAYMVKFYARQDANNVGGAKISAHFGLTPTAAGMSTVVIPTTDLIDGNYQEVSGYYTPATSGVYFFGIHGIKTSANWYITLDDISVIVAPTCPAPNALAASNATTTTMDLTWVENGTSTDWEVSYGIGSFNPNAGTIVTASTNPFTVTGLSPSTTYNFYVRTNCSASDSSTWFGPISAFTLCAPITALPWTENFDNLSTVSTTSFPPCWLNENPSPAVWSSTDAALSTITAGPLSPANYLRVRYNSDATMWTPEFDLVAGETYELTFNWAGSGNSGWKGSVYVNGSQSITGATMLGTSFIESLDVPTFDYQEETYCFVPATSGVYTFGVRMESTATSRYLGFDDFKLKRVITTPGIDGALSACQTGSPVDLNTVITAATTDGTWNFALNPSALNNAGILNVNGVPAGVHNFYFITTGCAPDTTIAKITVVQPSSAGNDGAIAVCRNQPLNLLSGLAGNADLGGVWTDPNAVVVPNGNTNASNIPGQYNYKYIVTNGVCPADTAKVVVNVQGCDWLGLEDVAFEGFNLYPNPTTDLIYITNAGSSEVFNYEVLDMNGRVILKANDAINGTATTEINLSQVEVGVYMVRVFNENADKTFRVVKN